MRLSSFNNYWFLIPELEKAKNNLVEKLQESGWKEKNTKEIVHDSEQFDARGAQGVMDFIRSDQCKYLYGRQVIYVNHVSSRPVPSSDEWVTVPFLSRVCSRSPTVRLWLARSDDGSTTPRSLSLCGGLRFLNDVSLNLS
ncbi:hypothetical protein KIN20_021783 [Parelaphostrongylus tenuis]|uniref:Uncharacterized protein n=1 Tax=Parelaphostrongylus tenuis TaxID=148309 RepID=A0AAD5MT58_PARTN|nr:hypothetical protein KIN20_021783 [Parelaphostrongylus tenuis]